jgi:hypothetical protein
MRCARFYLKIRPEELLEYYQGSKRFVRVRTYEGYTIQFRAEHLRKWVTAEGIHGEFEIRFDDQNKFSGLYQYRSLIGSEGALTRGGLLPSSESKHGSVERSLRQRPRGFKTSI